MKKTYFTIDELVHRIEGENGEICQKILEENRQLFETAQGSTYNHQTWAGGYIDHVTDGMNLCVYLYEFMSSFGRQLPFTESDALLVFFLHDIEKPWRIEVLPDGTVQNREGCTTKEDFEHFRNAKLEEYGIVLDDAQQNAMKYVEGEYKGYSSTSRAQNKLAAFCHMVDTWSARIWHNYPKEEDTWAEAGRFRTASGQ